MPGLWGPCPFQDETLLRGQERGLSVPVRVQGDHPVIRLVIAIISTEAMVYYAFHAGPLQPVREWVITHTPFLIARGEHVLKCKVCFSFWAGVAMGILYTTPYLWICYPLVFARVSNWLHLVFSLIADCQMDIRINRHLKFKEKKEK